MAQVVQLVMLCCVLCVSVCTNEPIQPLQGRLEKKRKEKEKKQAGPVRRESVCLEAGKSEQGPLKLGISRDSERTSRSGSHGRWQPGDRWKARAAG